MTRILLEKLLELRLETPQMKTIHVRYSKSALESKWNINQSWVPHFKPTFPIELRPWLLVEGERMDLRSADIVAGHTGDLSLSLA